MPAIGDDDEGRVIAQPPDREPRYVASIIAAVAGLTKRDDLPIPARDPHLRDAVFDSPQQSSGENNGLRVFEQGGVSVANDNFGRRVHLVFDHGPLGLMPLAAHGHADALAVWLTIDGEPVFIDAGTYRYFSGGDTRSELREGLAHNSLVITILRPAAPQPLLAGRPARRAPDRSHSGPGMVGEGRARRLSQPFRRSPCPTHQARGDRLLHRRPTGRQPRPLPVTLRFLCDPRVSIATEGDNVVISGSAAFFAGLRRLKVFR